MYIKIRRNKHLVSILTFLLQTGVAWQPPAAKSLRQLPKTTKIEFVEQLI